MLKLRPFIYNIIIGSYIIRVPAWIVIPLAYLKCLVEGRRSRSRRRQFDASAQRWHPLPTCYTSRLSILLRMCQFYSTFCPLPRDIRSLAPASVTGACFVFLSVSRFRSAADSVAATSSVGVIFVRCYNTKSGKEKEKHIIIICYACHLSRCWRQLQSNSANLLNADNLVSAPSRSRYSSPSWASLIIFRIWFILIIYKHFVFKKKAK